MAAKERACIKHHVCLIEMLNHQHKFRQILPRLFLLGQSSRSHRSWTDLVTGTMCVKYEYSAISTSVDMAHTKVKVW